MMRIKYSVSFSYFKKSNLSHLKEKKEKYLLSLKSNKFSLNEIQNKKKPGEDVVY